ncbi:MAG: hypothetical protein LBD09_06215, partial [Treponema sp.]|nr:hypothetical protein [Treponema sp.]
MARQASLVALQIKNQYSEFNPAMKQIADFILTPGNELPLSLGQLASASGVSDASVTRFVHLLNYKSFK